MVKKLAGTQKKPDSTSTQRTETVRFKGVRKRNWGKWVSEIRRPNSRERIWLGSYDTPEKAARAFDAALFCLRGRSAKFNFPNNPPEIPGGCSLTPAEIQTAAARFANSEPPKARNQHHELTVTSIDDSRLDSPSPSWTAVSEGNSVQLDMSDGIFSDLYSSSLDSSHLGWNLDSIPDFDEFFNELLTPSLPAVDYGNEDLDFILQDSLLWNF